MSEDLNRDPLVGKLARFTPSSAGIDRDALLFAAGRASAPKARGWKLIAAALALTQTITLGLWLTGPRRDSPRPAPTAEVRPEAPLPSHLDEPAAPGSYGELVRRWERGDLPPPAPAEDSGPPQPILSIAAGRTMFGIE